MTPPFLTTRQITPRVQACPFLLFSNYSQCIKAFYTIQKPAYKSIQFYLLNIKILEDSKRKINLCTSVTPQLGELNFQICFQSALMLPAAFTFVFGVWGGISFLLWQRSLLYPEASSPYLWECAFLSAVRTINSCECLKNLLLQAKNKSWQVDSIFTMHKILENT